MDTPQKPMSPADAKWAKDFILPSASSALPAHETQGQSARSSLATGSLPVSSAEALLEKWDFMADHWSQLAENRRKRGEELGAYTCKIRAEGWTFCASQLRWELERATERQPEENDQAQAQPPMATPERKGDDQ